MASMVAYLLLLHFITFEENSQVRGALKCFSFSMLWHRTKRVYFKSCNVRRYIKKDKDVIIEGEGIEGRPAVGS
jgi:hypothetical protein